MLELLDKALRNFLVKFYPSPCENLVYYMRHDEMYFRQNVTYFPFTALDW